MHSSASSVATIAALLVVATCMVLLGPRPQTSPPLRLFEQPAPRVERQVAGEQASRRPDRPARPRRATPRSVVVAYYRALDRRRFAAAWGVLSPAVRERFGGFAGWRAGYATTLHSLPDEIAVRARDGAAAVTLVLDAADRSPCGPVRRRFAVSWDLRRTERGWQAAGLTAVKLSGPDPGAACGPS